MPDKLKQLDAKKPKDWKWKDADELREVRRELHLTF